MVCYWRLPTILIFFSACILTKYIKIYDNDIYQYTFKNLWALLFYTFSVEVSNMVTTKISLFLIDKNKSAIFWGELGFWSDLVN